MIKSAHPDIMNLARGFSRFSDREYGENGPMPELVAAGQHPTYAMFLCADSRTPDHMFNQPQGTIFVPLRGVGALYRGYGKEPMTDAGVEYAIDGLKIPHLIVVGHYGCGFNKAMVHQNEDKKRGITPKADSSLAQLIEACAPLYKRVSDRFDSVAVCRDCSSLHRHVSEEGVRWSVENLLEHPSVKRAVADKRVQVWGMIDDLETGELRMLNSADGKFGILTGNNRPPVVPLVAPHCASPDVAGKAHHRIDAFHDTVGCACGKSKAKAEAEAPVAA